MKRSLDWFGRALPYTHQQKNENRALRTTLSKMTYSFLFPSHTQSFVFGSFAGASLTPLWMPESIVMVSMTSYSSISSMHQKKQVDDSAIAPVDSSLAPILYSPLLERAGARTSLWIFVTLNVHIDLQVNLRSTHHYQHICRSMSGGD